jgi:hypothetical protein
MPEYVHSIAELRNRFSYNPETGVILWRDVDFLHWARGRAQAKQGYYQKWRREKAGKPVQFQSSKNSVGKIYYRGVSYMAPRLAWALHYGKHPAETVRIRPKDGNWKNLRPDNLIKMSEDAYYRDFYAKMREKRGSKKYRDVPEVKHDAEKLQQWMYYNPTTGNLHWEDIGWKDWKKLNRKTTPDAHDDWQYNMADQPIQFRVNKAGDQLMSFKGSTYERKMLTFAIARGFHINNAVYLYHADGDETDFRIENLMVGLRGDWVDPDEEDEVLEEQGVITEVRWLDDDEVVGEAVED